MEALEIFVGAVEIPIADAEEERGCPVWREVSEKGMGGTSRKMTRRGRSLKEEKGGERGTQKRSKWIRRVRRGTKETKGGERKKRKGK